MKLLTIAVPCYNSQDYMQKCINSLLPGGDKIEIIIINDGSTDKTAAIADEYAEKYPKIVKVIHQKNSGHGGAINTGIKNASGLYFKVVDSDDWVDYEAYIQILDKLNELKTSNSIVDMIISNFVYEKEGINRKTVMHYDNILPENRIFTWKEIKRFPKYKYILMHSVIYKTELLINCGIKLPKHTFYVDNLFVYLPLPFVKTIYYANVNLYRYYIGRQGQSVNESVMIKRIDQQIKVNTLMIDLVDIRRIKCRQLRQFMFNDLAIITTVTSVMLIRSGTEEDACKRKAFWENVKNKDLKLYLMLRFGLLGVVANLPGRIGRKITITFYRLSKQIYGFN